jgi:peptidoglycan L-alanyl-D-glutamate endopeptidase CwlK
MPKLSKTSLDRLSTCHEDLIIFCNELIKYYDFTVVCGHRGQEEQDKAYADGYSKVKFPNSKHNSYPSMAVDLAPWEGKLDWGRDQMIFFAGFAQGVAKRLYDEGLIKHDIISGIDWDNDRDINDTKFFDAPHFQINS